ncbi:hypothetical protein PISL3812_00893 [Talaromyces islandicus]|uniref:Major facilitator superfamily (MFS) profile domain-containing protein n=1 Tax=Talaromyces islandicus TaxID=28573 RepID=A0A0U1LN35_TALIS|nr:hypothetical protein PISL3812_00893 [Talaromyces islandicus]
MEFAAPSSFVVVRALSGDGDGGGGIYMPNAITGFGRMVPPGQTRNLLYGIFPASPPIGGLAGAFLAGFRATRNGNATNLIPFGLGSTAAVDLAVFLIPRFEAKLIIGLGVIVIIGVNLLLATDNANASNILGRKHQGIASSLVGTLNLYGVSLGLGFAGTIEVEVAALYFNAALAMIGLDLDFALVKLSKVECHGWGEEDVPLEVPDVAVMHTSSEANAVA